MNQFQSDTNATENQQFSSSKFKQKVSYEQEHVSRILVHCKVLGIKVQSHDKENIQISWHDTDSWGLSVSQSGESLQLQEQNYLGFHNISDFFNSRQYSEVEIDVPKNYKGSFVLQTDTGNIEICDLDSDIDIEIKTTIGQIRAKRLSADSFTAIGSVGQIILESVRASINIENTATAAVKCTNISSDTSISIKSATASISCNINDEAVNYTTHCYTNYGHCNFPESSGNGPKRLDLFVQAGNIDVQFKCLP